MTPNPKVFGFKLPPTVEGGSSVSVTLCFPDLLEYRAAFNGQINMLGKWFQWAHTQADYQDIPEFNQQVAELWVQVLADAAWGVCMDFCEQMILCLTTDTDVQAALADLIATNPAIRAALSDFVAQHPNGSQYPSNQLLPSGVTSGNLSIENPDCDPDILWAQSLGFVQTANRMTTDFLETWETYTNAAETIPAIIGAIPFLGEIADIAGLDAISAYANSIIDSIAEGFAADYTLEYENALACEIFCASKDTCVISLDEICGIMNARLSGQLNLANGLELMLSLIDADISGINVADLYLCAFFNMLKLANLVLPITWGIESYLRVTRTFNVGSDDWEELCLECPPDDQRYFPVCGLPDGCEDQTVTFIERDGIWDVFDVTVFGPFPPYLGYTYAANLSSETGTGFRIEVLSGTEYAQWIPLSGPVDQGPTVPDIDLAEVGLFANSAVTARIKFRAVGL